MTLEKMNHRRKDYLGQKTKPTWSLLEDKVENKLFFSYDGDLFPPLTSNGKKSCYYGSSIPKSVEQPVGHSKQKAPFEVRSGVRNLTIRELGQIEELVEPADHVRSAVTQFGRLVPPSGSQRLPARLALGPMNFTASGGTGHLKPPGPLSGDNYSYYLLPQPHCGWKSNGHDPPPWIDETFADWLLNNRKGESTVRDPPWPSGKQASGLPIGQALARGKNSTQPLDRANPAHLALRQKAVPTKSRSRVSFYLSVSMADKKPNKKPPWPSAAGG